MSKIAEDFLRPFSTGEISALLMFATEMAVYGLSPGDVKEMCLEKLNDEFPVKENVAHKEKKQFLLCPRCGSVLNIYSVNKTKCTMVGGPWKASMDCTARNCTYSKMTEKTVEELST